MKEEKKFKHTETPLKIIKKAKASGVKTKKHTHVIGIENEDEVSTLTESFGKSPLKVKGKKTKVIQPNQSEISSIADSEILSKLSPDSEIKKDEIPEKENLSNNDIKLIEKIEEEKDEMLRRTFRINLYDWCTRHAIILIAMFSTLTPIYISNLENKKMISNLIKENELYKLQLENRINLQRVEPKEDKILKNYCDLTFGTKINYEKTTKIYNYGLLYKGTSKPLEILLDPYNRLEKYECVSFNGSKGQISIDFINNINLKRFILSHPYNKDFSSAIKEFQLLIIENKKEVLIYKSKYENKERSQYFEIPNKYINNLILRWFTNYGEKYTTIYKIYIIGN